MTGTPWKKPSSVVQAWGAVQLRTDSTGRRVKTGEQVTAILCGLYVKTNAWDRQFNRGRRAAPQKCAEYIQSEMIPGLRSIQESLMPDTATLIHPPQMSARLH
jgi:hypothetical protein